MDRDAEADADAVAQVLAGDREAFALVVARYAKRVHDLARRMLRDATEAEDVAQQAFLNAFRALARFDPRLPFRHWLLRITSNLCRNRLAERRRRPIAFGGSGAPDDDPQGVDRAVSASGESLGNGRKRGQAETTDATDAMRVRLALEALPERYRMTAVLRYAHGLSLEEIVEITEEPESTVKTHLHRARAALARLLAESPPSETDAARDGTKG